MKYIRPGEVNYNKQGYGDYDRVRLAVILKSPNTLDGDAKVTVRYLDTLEESTISFTVSQPYAGRGWGITVGVEKNSLCLVGFKRGGEPYIAAWLLNALYSDSEKMIAKAKAEGFPQDGQTPSVYPKFKVLKEGEIHVKSLKGASVFLGDDGSLMLSTPLGGQVLLDNVKAGLYLNHINYSLVTDAGTILFGPVRRAHTVVGGGTQTEYVTKLTGPIGIKDNLMITEAQHPSVVNPAWNALELKMPMTSDTEPDTTEPTPDIHMRLGTVVGDKVITGETSLHGKVLGDVSDATGLPTASASGDVAAWFYFKWKSVTKYFSIMASKLGWLKVRIPAPLSGPALDLKIMNGPLEMATIFMNADGTIEIKGLLGVTNKVTVGLTGVTLGTGSNGFLAHVGTNMVTTLLGPMPILPGTDVFHSG